MNARPAAVAGAFYPGRREELNASVLRLLGEPKRKRAAFGAIVPHAGYVYSGEVAGAVFSCLEPAPRVILLGPNHTGRGSPASLDSHDCWSTPLGEVSIDEPAASRLLDLCPSLEREPDAHLEEHSIEVELPFLQATREDLSIVPISIGLPSISLCREIGEACARVCGESDTPIQVLASSDMNHYESRDVGRRKNQKAYEKIAEVDPEGLFETVLAESISMCGFLPATALLFAARARGIRQVEVVALSDSGERTGDIASVVGYAGIVLGPG